MADSSARSVMGRIVVHPRGFGFVEVREPTGEVTSGFVPPPDLNAFFEDDVVHATLVTMPGGPFHTDPRETALVGQGRTFSLGQPLQVKATAVDEKLGRIDFALAE